MKDAQQLIFQLYNLKLEIFKFAAGSGQFNYQISIIKYAINLNLQVGPAIQLYNFKLEKYMLNLKGGSGQPIVGSRESIHIEFRTSQTDGLLFYTGDYMSNILRKYLTNVL